MVSTERGLELVAAGHRVVIPAALVERVVEVELSPTPPLARAWIGGLGAHGDEILVAIDLEVGGEPNAASGMRTCVLLDTGTGKKSGRLRWSLRVTRTVDFVTVRRCARPADAPSEWPTWMVGASLMEGGVVSFLDVARMAQELSK